ncbi:SpaA isopeptide-forming pilin-related protein [Erysipelothrix urinaevulpis]|uniref:SpaA isopeptide-forming pilin-related protein n=1 Tax=Erysipelothrix urinaevulpis TaxID=2683717 RepID=UPI001358BACF|nr:SpaA isopeptide-forming pilin-related protein [Erysipelothrix urinaevulpis]
MKKKNVLTIALVFMLLIGQMSVYADVEAPSTTDINALSPDIEKEDSVKEEHNNENNQKIEETLSEEAIQEEEIVTETELNLRDPENILQDNQDNVKFSNFKLLIDGKELEDGTVLTPGSFKNKKINYIVDWAINPDLVLVTGDFFTFKLPDVIDIKSVNQDGPLQNVMLDGEIIGQYLVENGQLMFKLKSSDLFNDVEGHINLEFELKEELFEEKQTIEIKNPFTLEDYVSVVIDEERVANNNSKTSQVKDKEFVEWTINVNRNGDKLENIVVEDSIDPALTILPDGVEVYKLIYNPRGEIVETLVVNEGIMIDGQDVKVDLGTINEAYKIIVKTKYNKEIPLTGNEKNPEVIHNHAVIKNSETDEQVQRVSAQAQLRFAPIAHKSSLGYDMANREMTWKIVYNSDKRLIKNPSLTDVFNGDVMNFIDESLEIKIGGKKIENPQQYLTQNKEGGFDFNYGEIKDVVEITYKTKIKDTIINPNPNDFMNVIELDGTQIGGAKPGINNGFIVKRAGRVDYKNQRIPWTITINQSYQMMENILITDTLASLGHDIDLNSIEVTKITKDNRGIRPEKIERVEASEYILKETDAGFTLEMNESSDSQFFISFYSTFDTSLIDTEDTNNANDYKLDKKAINKADLYFENSDLPDGHYKGSSTAEQTISDYSLKDGAKFGRYNAETKEITWYLFINANKLTESTKVYDVLSGNQDFMLPLIFEYAKFDYDQNANLNPLAFERLAYTSADKIISDKELVNEKEFKITVDHGLEESIVLKYKANLNDKLITGDYINKAILVNDKGNSTVVQEEVLVPNSGNHLSKSQVTGGLAPFLNWEMRINASQSVLENIKVIDQVDMNQSYVRDSLKVYDSNVFSNGALEKGKALQEGTDYSVVFTTDTEGNESFTLELHPDGKTRVERAYFVSYQVMYSAPENLQGHSFNVKNDVKMEADTVDSEDITVTDSVTSSNLSSAGAATAKNAQVSFQKVSENGNALEGVKFEFYYLVGGKEVFVTELTSDSQGMVKADKMRAGRYLIKEISTVDGHVISEKVFEEPVADHNGYITIKTNSENDLGHVENKFRKINIKKESSSQGELNGAQFELFSKLDDGTWKLIETSNVTGADGLATFNNHSQGILPGFYKVKEIKASENHILNTSELEFVISDTDQVTESFTYSFENHQGFVELIKVDGEDSTKFLENAKFNLYHNEHLVGTYTTNVEGKINVDNLAPGDYYFQEVKAPDSYLINNEKITFTIENESDKKVVKEVEATNYQASIEFSKKDEKNNGLSNVRFELVDEDQNVIQSTTSNSEGYVQFKNVNEGQYTIKEVSALDGYVLNSTLIDVVVPKSTNQSLKKTLDDFINYKAQIKFIKIDEAGRPLANSEFELRNENNELVAVATSDAKGQVIFKELSPGHYQISETKSDENHLINLDKINVVVPKEFEGQPIIDLKDFVNYQASIEFMKVNEEQKALANSVFELIDEQGDSVKTATSDENGKVLFENIKPGSYEIQEVKASDGYLINTETVKVSVPKEFSGKITLNENDFINYQAKIGFNKKSASGNPLKDVVFGLYNQQDELLDTLTSNEAGRVEVDGLKPGSYSIKELETVSGYILNSNEISFEIPESFSGKLIKELDDVINYKAQIEFTKKNSQGEVLSDNKFALIDATGDIVTESISDVNGLVTFKNVEPGLYTIKELEASVDYLLNETVVSVEVPSTFNGNPIIKIADFINHKANVQFNKVNEAGTAIAGSIFELKDSEGNLLQTSESDENGLVQFTELSPGDYEVTEVKTPSEYLLNRHKVLFTVPEKNEGKASIKLDDFINYQASIEFNKVNENKEILAESTFVLINQSQEIVREAVSDETGKVLFNNVAPGHYTIKETHASHGYLVNEEVIEVDVPTEHEGKLTLSLSDFMNYTAMVQFNKVDQNGNGLNGVVFGLYDAQGTLLTQVESDEQGLVKVDGLAPGSYVFKELQAKEGYILNSQEIPFEVTDRNLGKLEIELEDFVNYQGSVHIKKVDENGELITDYVTEFNLLDRDKKIITENLVTIEGVLHLENLAPGHYFLQEVKAPEGFELSTEFLEFEIQESFEGVYEAETLEFVNHSIEEALGAGKTPSLPSTGLGNTTLYISLALTMIGMILLVVSKLKKD